MGSVNFETTVTKNVDMTKNVDLLVNKAVVSDVEVDGSLATAEASADAIDLENVLAETDTFAQVSSQGAFSFSSSLAAGERPEVVPGIETLVTNVSTDNAVNGQDLSLSLTSHGENLDATSPVSGEIVIGDIDQADLNIAIAVDISGSTGGTFSGDVTVGDLNNDGAANTILDAEIDAILALVDELNLAGFDADDVDIALIPFDGSAASFQLFDDPADAALETALTGLQVSGGTNFEPPLQEAIDFFDAQSAGSNFLYFLSDGFGGGAFLDEVATLTDPAGINASIIGIGVGNGANQAQLDQIDNTAGSDIVTDPNQLRDAVIEPELSVTPVDFDILIDGVAVPGLDETQLTQVLNTFSFDFGEVPGFNVGDTQTITAEVTFDDGTTLSVTNDVDNVLI